MKNGSIYALMALGFTIIFAATGVINFAQGEFFMLGGITAAYLHVAHSLPLPLACAAAITVTAAIGVIFETLAIRPRKDGDPLALIIITVGGSILLSSLARHFFGPDPLSLSAFSQGGSVKVAGDAIVDRQTLWIWGITAVTVVGLAVMYSRTSLGRAMRATAVDRQAARLMGIDTTRVVTVAFGLAAALGAVAGVAVTPLTQSAFDVGAPMGVKGFAAAILGGLGNPVGAVVGGLVLGLIESLTTAFLSSTYKDAVSLVVLLLVLFVRPQGMFGRAQKEKV